MFNAINTSASARFGVGSNVALVSKVGAGQEAIVTSVGIGEKLDHMESRERNFIENHSFKTLTVSTALTEERNQQLRDGFDDLDEDEPAS